MHQKPVAGLLEGARAASLQHVDEVFPPDQRRPPDQCRRFARRMPQVRIDGPPAPEPKLHVDLPRHRVLRRAAQLAANHVK